LPEDLRDYNRVLDGPALKSLLQNVARNHPEKYRDISYKLNQVGLRSAQDQGGMSFGARHLMRSKVANEVRTRIQDKLKQILSNDQLSDKERSEQIIKAVGNESMPQIKAVLEEAVQNKNPLGMQVMSGTRGKAMNLASLIASDMLYSDHHDEVIPIPVLRSYSEGLSPEEYWAGTYGARRGIMSTKFATQEAGFLSKQLNQAGHRLVVMGEEPDEVEGASLRGMIADTDDNDNEGSLLAQDTGPYKKNTPLTPKILNHLKRLGKNRILVRSPIIGGSPEGGVYARDVGIREHGALPGRGEQVGLQAAQALSEPISQGQLSAKHSGGVAGQEKAVGGFQYINQLIQTPKKMQGGASHSTLDGRVQRIEPAPAGGHNVIIGGQQHYVADGFELKVKPGDEVEAGDMLSDGIPNPAVITQYKGVGEGRRYFVNEFRKAMANSGMRGHRRNIELLARGLINHVKLTEEIDDNVPDDVIPYSTLEHTYKPREGHENLLPKKAVGQYLERPVLHYTIGTKVRPSMLKDFEEFGVGNVTVHKNPPPFEPHMVRGMYQLQHDPDWLTQMYGSGLKQSLLDSVARGAKSEARGTSFVSSLATGTDFGEVPDRAVIQPQKPYAPPNVPLPKIEEPAPMKMAFFGGKYVVNSNSFQKNSDDSTQNKLKPTSPASSVPMPPTVKAPANQPIPASTANTPKSNPSSASDMFGNNIMPPSPTFVPTNSIPQPSNNPASVPSPANMAKTKTDYDQSSKNLGYQPMDLEQYFDLQRNLAIMNGNFAGPSRQLATSTYGQKMNPFSPQGGLNYGYSQPQFNMPNNYFGLPGNPNNFSFNPNQNSNNDANDNNSVNKTNPLQLNPDMVENPNSMGFEATRYLAADQITRKLNLYPTALPKPPTTNWNAFLARQVGNLNPLTIAKSLFSRGSLVTSGIADAADAFSRSGQNIISDADAWKSWSSYLYNNPTMAPVTIPYLAAGALLNPFTTAQSAAASIATPSLAKGQPAGDYARAAAQAKQNRDNPEYNPDLNLVKDNRTFAETILPYGFGGKANPLDPRTFLQWATPKFLFGKDKPSFMSQQTEENQEILRERKQWDEVIAQPNLLKPWLAQWSKPENADHLEETLKNLNELQRQTILQQLEQYKATTPMNTGNFPNARMSQADANKIQTERIRLQQQNDARKVYQKPRK
jgi:hypothetical protein